VRRPFAVDAGGRVARAAPEPEHPFRSPFQRDRDRILHSTAFRRLQYKTQVFVHFEGDHYRTRLTHTLEVAQIARTLARALGVDEDLAEAVALAHDLGHPPFGHAGERALDEAARAFGGFDHNLQTFRIVTELECRYAGFPGLNLTAATLEGIVKHNGPITSDVPAPVRDHPLFGELRVELQAPLEAQIAALCDDLAYCSHDLDDGLRAGLLVPRELFDVSLAGEAAREVWATYGELPRERFAHETVRRVIDRLVRDLFAETERRIARWKPDSADAVRALPEPLAAFPAPTARALGELRAFLHERVYRHYKVLRATHRARRVVRELFETLLAAPECLPDGWRGRAGEPGSARTAAVVRDYIAGMTDRYAAREHRQLCRTGWDDA